MNDMYLYLQDVHWKLTCFLLSDMENDSDSESEVDLTDPYRDDPDWREWHALAVDVQGGQEEEEETSSEEDDDAEITVSLPKDCVCQNCR